MVERRRIVTVTWLDPWARGGEAEIMTALGLERPRLRGVIHQAAFFIALAAGIGLVLYSPAGKPTWAALVYATSLVLLLGISATYHRVLWQPRARAWMRRLDHSAIFVLIAGTYTPFCLALPEGRVTALVGIWSAAAVGALKSILWPHAPKWIVAALCVAMGWGGLALVPTISATTGTVGLALIVLGGVLYSLGAVVYALRRPNPWPQTFGYHEIFHSLVVLAALLHFIVVLRVVGQLGNG